MAVFGTQKKISKRVSITKKSGGVFSGRVSLSHSEEKSNDENVPENRNKRILRNADPELAGEDTNVSSPDVDPSAEGVESNDSSTSLDTPYQNAPSCPSSPVGANDLFSEDPTPVPVNIDDEIAVAPKSKKGFNPIDPSHEINDVKALFPTENYDDIVTIGCDEAGRGPLVGPVFSAACYWLEGSETDHLPIRDSKLVTKEAKREELFELMMESPGLFWAAVEVSAETIDKMNILNASLFGMSLATSAVMDLIHTYVSPVKQNMSPTSLPPMLPLCEGVDIKTGMSKGTKQRITKLIKNKTSNLKVAMLCDGDKLPHGTRPGDALAFTLVDDVSGQVPAKGWLVNQWKIRSVEIRPCACIKGDATHRSIASASIIAKVLRDRKMTDIVAPACLADGTLWGTFYCEGDEHEMRDIYKIENATEDPYGIGTNKGYPTKSQKECVADIGATMFHRLSFKPTYDLLLANELKMPVELETRAFEFILEKRRRDKLIADMKELEKLNKKRARLSFGEESGKCSLISKKQRMSGQMTLESLFQKKR